MLNGNWLNSSDGHALQSMGTGKRGSMAATFLPLHTFCSHSPAVCGEPLAAGNWLLPTGPPSPARFSLASGAHLCPGPGVP